MAGFQFVKSLSGSNDVLRKMQLAPSQTVVKGNALEFTYGKLSNVDAQTDVVYFVAHESGTSTATSKTLIEVIPAAGTNNIFQVGITPLLNDVTVVSSTSTTVVCAASAGSSNDMRGGVVRVAGQDRLIASNTYGGGNVTITVSEAWDVNPTTSDSVRAVSFGPGTTALKLNSSTPQNLLSTTLGDETGGKVRVIDVNLEKKFVNVIFVL